MLLLPRPLERIRTKWNIPVLFLVPINIKNQVAIMVNSVGAEDKRSKPSYENNEIYRRKSIPVSKPQQIKDGRFNIVPSTPTPTILDKRRTYENRQSTEECANRIRHEHQSPSPCTDHLPPLET